MTETELPKMAKFSQQDMDLIDILWKQDVDLGAGREAFDYTHRQKENELQKERELEKEKQQQLQREQEKALLAQLHLDEETGEFVPHATPRKETQTTAMPPEATQNLIFTEEEEDAFTFDECMQLLADTFPLVEAIEIESLSLDPSILSPTDISPVMMPPHQLPLAQAPLLPTLQSPPKTPQDLQQTWMELLTIPELQQCMNMQIEDMLEPTSSTATSGLTEIQDESYWFYENNLTDAGSNTASTDTVSPEYLPTSEGTLTSVLPPDDLNQTTQKSLDLNSTFGEDCNMCYMNLTSTHENSASPAASSGHEGSPLAEVPKEPLLKPMGNSKFTPEEGCESSMPEMMADFPDSDSSLSLDSSSKSSLPEKPVNMDDSSDNSDTEEEMDMEEMELKPRSAEDDYTEMFTSSFQVDDYDTPSSVTSSQSQSQGTKPDLAEYSDHSKPPFTKDKPKRSAGSRSRLSRDERRAKALQIPITVDMIINLPVDEFNEVMSKQQLSEAQLLLVRDIRRRGKNKVAAQNCRKRKMENVVGLEYELDSLKEERDRLLREKAETRSSLQDMKQQLESLYLEVFSLLSDEEGKPYSPREFSLEQTSDGNVFLIPRTTTTVAKRHEK
ncbi:hypothetical protein AAFF_G00351330 [Aldrovandia affinis]|uniref:BZIP domain-containing protein n=1 Tax=Aldrovandia affinis TaxID=143900 RepID=A0AAD7WNA6_9TELE|nr:hypothetical protein AAFF_G00351330 [Aldrovandia affinis]